MRNKKRTGRGTYSRNKKRGNADRYGEYVNGVQMSPDRLVRWEPEGRMSMKGKAA